MMSLNDKNSADHAWAIFSAVKGKPSIKQVFLALSSVLIIALLFVAFSIANLYLLLGALALGALLLSKQRAVLLLPWVLGAAPLLLLFASANLGLPFAQRLALGAALGAAAGYSLIYCLTTMFSRRRPISARS